MIPPRTNKPGLEVITSPINASKATTSNNNELIPVSPGRVKRLAGITPNPGVKNTSSGPVNRFFRKTTSGDENTNTSNYGKPQSQQQVLRSNSSLKDRYVIQSKPSSPRIGVQHGILHSPSNTSRGCAVGSTYANNNNILKAHGYQVSTTGSILKSPSNNTTINNAPSIPAAPSTTMPPLKQTYSELPSLLTYDSETFEDESITDTSLYKKFREAFELTLKSNPGILPGSPSVIESVEKALYKLTQSKVEREEGLRRKIAEVKKEKEDMENKLSSEMGNLALERNELSAELEKLEKEKNVSQDSLQKQLEAVKAMKADVQARMDEATKEKEELTKHLGFLSKSRVELETALEKEMKLVEKDRDELQRVIAERKNIQKQKAENKELESKIEIMTAAATKEKAALQAEAAELKSFEGHLAKLKQSNEETRKELEEEKRQLMEITRTLQTKKQAVIESKQDIEKGMQAEIEELEAQIENSRMMHSKDMETLVKSKVVNYLKRGPPVEDDESTVAEEEGMDIESIVKARVEAELKAKDIEMKERELALKEQEMNEREMRDREIREQEAKERKKRERELEEKMKKEMETRERELEEKILREKEAWEREERERKEQELIKREQEMKEKIQREREEERERKGRELAEREREMKEKIQREREEMKNREEAREREAREKAIKAKEEKFESMRKRRGSRSRRSYHSDDDDTLGDDSTIQSEVQMRRTRSSRSRSRARRYHDDDESTVASTENRKKRHTKKKEDKKSSKEEELQKELEELRKEIAKNKNESNETREVDDLLKHRRESTGIISSMRKYFSPQDELRGEIASLREEIKMNHRESPALRHGAAPYPHQESSGYHDSPGMMTYASAPPRDYHHHESPGMASYVSAPAERPHYEPERRSTFRRRYDDEDDAFVDHRPMSRSRRGYEDEHEYETESRFRGSRFSSPGPVPRQTRSPGPRNSTSGIMKSKYYL